MNWLEVSLAVNGELAEAVADVLARFAPPHPARWATLPKSRGFGEGRGRAADHILEVSQPPAGGALFLSHPSP